MIIPQTIKIIPLHFFLLYHLIAKIDNKEVSLLHKIILKKILHDKPCKKKIKITMKRINSPKS